MDLDSNGSMDADTDPGRPNCSKKEENSCFEFYVGLEASPGARIQKHFPLSLKQKS
jgi:hypothetical protein